jgi:hypothetical protein
VKYYRYCVLCCITEIISQNDKALNIVRMQIKSVIYDFIIVKLDFVLASYQF